MESTGLAIVCLDCREPLEIRVSQDGKPRAVPFSGKRLRPDQVCVRLPPGMRSSVEAKAEGRSISQVVRELLQRYVLGS